MSIGFPPAAPLKGFYVHGTLEPTTFLPTPTCAHLICIISVPPHPRANRDYWYNNDNNNNKLRGGYYPRIFFPGLYNAKERFLKKFETVYYLKALPGGWIFRRAPEDWQVNFTQDYGRGVHGVFTI